MTVRAKTLVKNKFWIVEQNGQKLGTLQKQEDNGWIFLSKQDKRQVFHTQESLFTKFGFGIFDESNISEKFGVPADRILDYLSIIGDQSDNIPGLRGVGPKTAVKWLAEYKSLEGIIENAGRLKPKRFCSLVYEQRELLHRNVELVKLLCDVDFEPTRPQPPNLSEIDQILTEMEMHKSLEEAQLRYPN